jgi:glycosyltransferase involved in cell wall biosynthesis
VTPSAGARDDPGFRTKGACRPAVKICVLIPAFNEARAIGPLVTDVSRRGFDTVVVDDGSSDGTADIARAAGATVLINPVNGGKGFSLRRGFDYAVEKGYDAAITVDGDGQHSPEDLDAFVGLFEKKRPDIICGNRMPDTRQMPLIRFLTNKVMSGLLSWVCHQKIADSQCGYRLIRTEVLRNVQLSCSAFESESEILIEACRRGYRVVSVPIRTIYKDEQSKIRPLRDTVRFIAYILKARRPALVAEGGKPG